MKDQQSRMPMSLKGINRNPSDSLPDGALLDALNMRYSNSSLRPVQPKLSADFSVPQFNILFKHVISETIFAWWGEEDGYVSYYLYINGEPDTLESMIYYFNDPATLHFSALGKSLLISCEQSETTVLFLYDSDSALYTYFEDFIPPVPYMHHERVASSGDDETKEVRIDATTFDADEPKIQTAYKSMANDLVASKSKKGYLIGDYLVRFAWELFDGSIVGHTIPDVIMVSNLTQNFDVPGPVILQCSVAFEGYSIEWTFNMGSSELTAFKAKWKGIIISLNMYLTKIADLNYQSWDILWNNGGVTWFSMVFQNHDTNYTKRWVENEIFYFKAKSVPIEDLEYFGNTTNLTIADTSMIPTGAVMTPTSPTIHKLYAKALFSYNHRIFLGNDKVTLFKGQPVMGMLGTPVTSPSIGTTYYVGLSYDISTPDGTRSVFTGWQPWISYTSGVWGFTFKPYFWGYPDSRAKRCQLWYNNDAMNSPHLLAEVNLTPVAGMNFAIAAPNIYIDPNGGGLLTFTQAGSLWVAGSPPAENTPGSYYDADRIQATEFNNPFYFPAVNSYRVDGFVLGMATNAIALSQGQFGQFPIYAFTSQGIWVMTIGNGDILIETIKPLSRLIATNPKAILGIEGAVVFASDEGLMILSGGTPINISKEMEGSYISPLADNLDYQQIINNPNVMTPYQYREEQQGTFENFMNFCSIAFIAVKLKDSVQRELILSAEESYYSYLYNFDSKTWSRITSVWEHFVFDWPFAYGVRANRANNPWVWYMDDLQYEFQDESGDDVTYPVLNFYAETRPIKFGETISFKKILRAVLYGLIKANLNHPFTFYIFGSPDDKNWHTLNASNTIAPGEKIILGRSSFSCRSFIVVVGGHVADTSYLSGLIFDIEKRYNQKLH